MLKFEFDIDFLLIWIIVIAVAVALLYILFDVGYFVRTILHIAYGRIFERDVKITDSTSIYGYCFTNDLDIMFLHMNNARYVRELDFARFHFYDRTGLYKKIVDGKGTVVQSACSIRYRRPISIFTPFTVTTKIIDWDERNIYLEQNFITVSDNFIRATVLSKQTVTGPLITEIMESLLENDKSFKPNSPEELKDWRNCLEVSSNRMKKKD